MSEQPLCTTAKLSMDALEVLRRDIEIRGLTVREEDWHAFCAVSPIARFRKGAAIFGLDDEPNGMFYVSQGIVSANMLNSDGKVFIYRFFERGHLCTRISSAWSGAGETDTIECVTDVRGIMIPFEYWKKEYLSGGSLGEYFRQKALEALLFAKDVIRIKTLSQTRLSYEFLLNQHETVVDRAPQKTIAKFIGVTPEAMNRFLRTYNEPEED